MTNASYDHHMGPIFLLASTTRMKIQSPGGVGRGGDIPQGKLNILESKSKSSQGYDIGQWESQGINCSPWGPHLSEAREAGAQCVWLTRHVVLLRG